MARRLKKYRTVGFTLVELAVVMAIVALLLSGLMYTLSAQVEQRGYEETRRRLDLARDLLLGYALVNGRLPCPARSTSAGFEARDATTGQCTSGGVEDYYGGALSGGATGGLLPAATIGFLQADGAGFGVDAWQNRIRYAVSKSLDGTTCTVTATWHFTNATSMKANGIACQPSDLIVCKSATGINATTCGGSSNQVMSQGLAVAIIFSTGRNGGTGANGTDEATNLKGNASLSPLINPVFVSHTPTPSGATNGEFDDQFSWITTGELYGKLISGGLLP
jgi:prepilin-type N-terminal cleavage/methylation domain-containing protein